MNQLIKVGFCVAYDWEYLKISLPLVYGQADSICLSLDRERKSWAGNSFAFDTKVFLQFISQIDTAGKVSVYEDAFHLPELSPMQNEVRQRNLMAEFLGAGGWHIQLDTDEYFVNFAGFVQYLRQYRVSRPVNITCPWYVMYKETTSGYLFVDTPEPDYIAIATTAPIYEYGRRNSYFNVKTNFVVLHQSWARSDEEILQKIENWGHKNDFDVMSYYNRWKELNDENFADFRDFHPVEPAVWNRLELVSEKDINKLVEYLQLHPPFQVPQKQLDADNSIWRSRLRALLKKLKLS